MLKKKQEQKLVRNKHARHTFRLEKIFTQPIENDTIKIIMGHLLTNTLLIKYKIKTILYVIFAMINRKHLIFSGKCQISQRL